MAISTGFLKSASVTLTENTSTVHVTGGVDCSFVSSGTAIFLDGSKYIVEGISGTAANLAGESTITLREKWEGETLANVSMTAFNTIEGLRDAIRRARDIVKQSKGKVTNTEFSKFLTTTDEDVEISLGGATVHTTAYAWAMEQLKDLLSKRKFEDLENVPSSLSGAAGLFLAVKSDESGLEFVAAPSGGGVAITRSTDLKDMPSSLAGEANKILQVNHEETGYILVDMPTGGGSGGSADSIPNFNSTKSYQGGDSVIYSNKLYQAKGAIASGPFRESDWNLIGGYNKAEMDNKLKEKVNVSDFDTEMAKKADQATTSQALNQKVDKSDYNEGMGYKADKTAVTTALNQKVDKSSVVNNFSTTTEGKVLDARAGQVLNEGLQTTIFDKDHYVGLNIPAKRNPDPAKPYESGRVLTTQDTLNHLFTFAHEGKVSLQDACAEIGVTLPDDPTFQDIADALKALSTDLPSLFSELHFERYSKAFDIEGNILDVNVPAKEEFAISTLAFEELTNVPPVAPIPPDIEHPDYTTAISEIKAVAASFADLDYNNLCDDYEQLAPTVQPDGSTLPSSGREMPVLSYKIDDPERPIMFFQSAIHGNERKTLVGFLEFIKALLTSTRDDMVWARNNLSFVFFCMSNPDGYALDRRRNGVYPDGTTSLVGTNLSRNWDYFWDYAADPDKGSSPFSAVETRNLKAFMEKNKRVERGVMFIDFHGWYSRTIFGFLTDHNYVHGLETQTLHRSMFHFSNYLVQQRDYTGYPIVDPLGKDNIIFDERSSTRKPYAPYWAQQRFSKYKGFAYQVEWPQQESQALIAQVVMSVIHASILSVKDHLSNLHGKKTGIMLDPNVSETEILNPNSLLDDWSTYYSRYKHFRAEGLIEQQSLTDQVDLFRPITSAYPIAVERAATAGYYFEPPASDPDNIKDQKIRQYSFFMTVGGLLDSGITDRCYIEKFVPDPPPKQGSNKYGIYKPSIPQIRIKNFPVDIYDHDVVYCNGSFYAFFGRTAKTGGYSKSIWKITLPPLPDAGLDPQDEAYQDAIHAIKSTNWVKVKDSDVYTDGLCRHSLVVIGTDIYVLGGRTPDDYQRTITRFDTKNDQETELTARLPYKNGWFSVVKHPTDGNIVYYMGGWNGSSCKDDTWEMVFDDVTKEPTITRKSYMPDSRRQFAAAYVDGKISILAGIVQTSTSPDTYDYSLNLLQYDIDTDTWESKEQTSVSQEGAFYTYDNSLNDDEDPYAIANVNTSSPAYVENRLENKLYIIGGETTLADGSDKPTNNFFEFGDNSLSGRKVNDVAWGTYRPSVSRELPNNVQPVTVVSGVRNTTLWLSPEDMKVNPYVRPINYIGASFGTTKRWRHKYTITPKDKRVTLPVYAPPSNSPSGEDRCYSYFRHYGEGTKMSMFGHQIIQGKIIGPRLVPYTGMQRELALYYVKSSKAEFEGAYYLRTNHQFDYNIPVVRFESTNGLQVTIRQKTRNDDGSAAGDIYAEFFADGGNTLLGTKILGSFAVNFDKYTNIFKRDIIHWKFNQNLMKVSVWAYGKTMEVVFPKQSQTFKLSIIRPYYENSIDVGLGFYLKDVKRF